MMHGHTNIKLRHSLLIALTSLTWGTFIHVFTNPRCHITQFTIFVGLKYGTSYHSSGAYSVLVDSRFLEGLFTHFYWHNY